MRQYNEHGILVLTDKDRARLAKVDADYTAHHLANRVTYPEPDQLHLLDMPAIQQLGFSDHMLDVRPEDLNIDDILGELVGYRHGRRGRGRNRNRGNQNQGGRHGGSGNQNQGGRHGGGGGGKTLMNPQVVLSVVQAQIQQSGAKPVTASGKVVWGEQNFEFLDASKAKWFVDSYKELIPLAHIWLCAEITQAGLDVIAQATGYKAYAGTENNRGQAVGILVHPSIKVIGEPVEDNDVGNVQGIPNLRPSFLLNCQDWNNNQFWACAIHLKSMRGGPQTTAAVRYQQCQILANHLKGTGIVGGDWNSKLRSTSDTKPLTLAGFVMAAPGDTRSTQAMGGDLDGFFQLNMPTPLGPIELWPWFSNQTIGRGLTDHGTLRAS